MWAPMLNTVENSIVTRNYSLIVFLIWSMFLWFIGLVVLFAVVFDDRQITIGVFFDTKTGTSFQNNLGIVRIVGFLFCVFAFLCMCVYIYKTYTYWKYEHAQKADLINAVLNARDTNLRIANTGNVATAQAAQVAGTPQAAAGQTAAGQTAAGQTAAGQPLLTTQKPPTQPISVTINEGGK